MSTTSIDESLDRINQTIAEGHENLNRFSADLFAIARETETSIDAVVKGAQELARQGLNRADLLTRLKDTMVLYRIMGDATDEYLKNHQS